MWVSNRGRSVHATSQLYGSSYAGASCKTQLQTHCNLLLELWLQGPDGH